MASHGLAKTPCTYGVSALEGQGQFGDEMKPKSLSERLLIGRQVAAIATAFTIPVSTSGQAITVSIFVLLAALTVKAAFVVLTILGHASLWSAIAADTGMSLLVVFNALRLLRGNVSVSD